MTLLGAIFIPIALACLLLWPRYLLPLLIVASIFEAGSVYNAAFGSFVFGVSPFYFVELCIALRLVASVWQRGRLVPECGARTREIALVLLLFVAWSCFSAFVLPHLFAGTPVYSARERADMDILQGNLTPLVWSLSNFAQAAYSLLNAAAAFFALRAVTTTSDGERLAKSLRFAVFIVLVAGALQQLAIFAHWSYPYGVFNNNPNNPTGTEPLDQEFYGFVRTSSTFAEPMNSGSFLAAVTTGLFASYLRGRRSGRYLVFLLICGLVLLTTASSTGYLTFFIMAMFLLIYFHSFGRHKSAIPRSHIRTWGFVAVAGLCVAVTCFLIPGLSQAFAAMTIDKVGGVSFATRVIADLNSLAILRSTYGLGVGLGSNRPSSLIIALLSTVGVIGTVLFARLVYLIVKLFPGRTAPSMLQMGFWSFIGLILAQAIAVPDINRPALWALFVVVLAELNVYWIYTEKLQRMVVPKSLPAAESY